MKQIFYFLMFFVFITSCSEDSDLTGREMFFGDDANPNVQIAKDYNAFPTNKRTTLFLENFNNNSNNWPIIQPNSIPSHNNFAIVSNGKYYISGDSWGQTIHQYTINLSIDTLKDFEIETSVILGASLSKPYECFRFGCSDISNGYSIYLMGLDDPKIIIDHKNNEELVSKEFPVEISNYDIANHNYAKISIRKISNSFLIFVNEKYVGKISFKEFSGSKIGYKAYGEYKSDYIKIDYLTF